MRPDVLVAYAMNGAPLPPQHGAPLRLVVPRWYGMASVKWLQAIEAVDRPFDGFQQARGYHPAPRRREGRALHAHAVNLMAPPGIPDFYAPPGRMGEVLLAGRAWSGNGPVTRVEWALDGAWQDAVLEPARELCWRGWSAGGRRRRASTSSPAGPPMRPATCSLWKRPWDLSGFGNNGVQRIHVTVRS